MNACGIDDFHDGVNYTRTACVIAVSKARDIFEPFLHQVSPLLSSPPTTLLLLHLAGLPLSLPNNVSSLSSLSPSMWVVSGPLCWQYWLWLSELLLAALLHQISTCCMAIRGY